ncbi:MAG: DUF86 domain-containing protein [Elusimicrobiota bacterium]
MPPGINDREIYFQQSVKTLKEIRQKYSLSEITKEENYILRDALERNFERLVVSFIDIANKLISEKGWQKPRSYKDTLTVLIEHNLIDKSENHVFEKFVNERNIVTHEYADVNYTTLYDLLDHLDKVVRSLEKIISELNKDEI